MFAIVIIGPPGVGKTSALTALQNLLADSGVRHAAVEVEALAWSHPPLPDDLSFRHVRAVRDLFEAEGFDLILCGATVTSDAYMSALLDALAPTRQLVVRLEAREQTLRERIVRREPSDWSGLRGLLTAAGVIAATSRTLSGVDAVYSTENLAPNDVASRVAAAMSDTAATSE